MPKYKVEMRCTLWVTVEVEAPDDDKAMDTAYSKGYIQGYSGNGAISGKLVGTDDPDVTITASDELEFDSITEM